MINNRLDVKSSQDGVVAVCAINEVWDTLSESSDFLCTAFVEWLSY
jgi:hypothetical protein